jgi:hypothetical protein
MEESEKFIINIKFKSGRKLTLETTGTCLEWLFDTCFKRSEAEFCNIEEYVVNTSEIEYFTYEKIQEND